MKSLGGRLRFNLGPLRFKRKAGCSPSNVASVGTSLSSNPKRPRVHLQHSFDNAPFCDDSQSNSSTSMDVTSAGSSCEVSSSDEDDETTSGSDSSSSCDDTSSDEENGSSSEDLGYSEDSGSSESGDEIDLEDRVLWLAAYNAFFRLSDTGGQKSLLSHLSSITSGSKELCFNPARADILTEEILKAHQIEHITICPGSSHQIPNRGQCNRPSCPQYGKPIKRQSKFREKEFALLDCIPQLIEKIETHGVDILWNHERARHPALVNSREEPIMCPRVRQSIESEAEFQNGNLNICVTVNFDGFRPSKLSKNSWWPLYLRLESLRGKLRKSEIVFAGFFSTRSEMTEADIQLLLTRLQGELERMRLGNMTVRIGNKQYRVRVIITGIVVDLPAARKFLGIGQHNCYQNCLLCLQRGTRPVRGMVTYSSPVGALRGLGALNDATNGRNGFTGNRWAVRVLDPSVLLPDYLHCGPEGTPRDVVRSIFGSGSKEVKCSQLTVTAVVKTRLSDALASILPPTSAHTTVADPSAMNQLNGDEMLLLFNATIPLSVAENVFEEPEQTGCVYLLWLLLLEVKLPGHTADSLNTLCDEFDELYASWSEVMGARMNGLKAHMLIGHMSFMLKTVGPPHAVSSSHFESTHRKFHRNVNPTTTNNGVETALRSKLAHLTFSPMVAQKVMDGGPLSSNFSALYKVLSNGREVFPMDVRISADIYIPKYSSVSNNLPACANLLPQSFEYSSRIIIGNVAYTAEALWSRARRTQSYGVVWETAGEVHFGRVQLIGYVPNHEAKLVVNEEKRDDDVLLNFMNDLQAANTPTSRRLLQQVIRNESTCKKYLIKSKQHESVVIDAESVVAPCMFASYQGHKYVLRYVA